MGSRLGLGVRALGYLESSELRVYVVFWVWGLGHHLGLGFGYLLAGFSGASGIE